MSWSASDGRRHTPYSFPDSSDPNSVILRCPWSVRCLLLLTGCWLAFCGFPEGGVLACHPVLQSAAECPFLPHFRHRSSCLLFLTIGDGTRGAFSLVDGADPLRSEILSSNFIFPLYPLFLSFPWSLSLLRNSVLVISILINLSLHAAGVERRCS